MEIQIRNIRKKYGKNEVLKGVSFFARPGECVGILGGNGSGKSTLFSVLAGVNKSDGGSFFCGEKDLLQNPGLLSRMVSYIPQKDPLMPELTARDHLSLWYEKEDLERELEQGLLSLLGIGDFLKIPVSKMSGGMKKRLSIGCAAGKRSPILILDEPDSGLDLPCKECIRLYLEKHMAAGGIVLLATHDLRQIEFCQRLYLLKKGETAPYDFRGDVPTLLEDLR